MTETSRPGRHSSWARLMTFPQVLAEPSRAQTQGLAPSTALEPGTSPGAGAAPACSPCGRTPPPLPALQGVPRRLLQNSVPTAFPVAPSPASFLPALGALTPHLAAGGDCGGPHTELRSTSGQASSAGEPPGPCAPTRRPGWEGPCARARLHWSMCPRSNPCRLRHTPRLVPGEGWQPSHACTLPATPEALPWPVQEPRALPPDRTAPRALAGDRRSSSFSRAHRRLW